MEERAQREGMNTMNKYADLWVYAVGTNLLFRIAEGTGDNLLPEDEEQGYVDYIYYDTYRMDDNEIREEGGGQVMLTQLFREKYQSTKECVPDVMDMEFGNRDCEFIVLGEKGV